VPSTTRVKFLEKMFDIILDNLISDKYKFKLFHSEDETVCYDELKRLTKLSKYQKSELAKENRLTKIDEFLSKFDPNVKQYNFLVKYCREHYSQVRNKIIEAVNFINKGRNL